MNPKFLIFFGAVTSLMMLTSTTVASGLSCHQCVGGDFLLRKNLMQNPRALQSMGWVHEWSDTDCLIGNTNVIPNCQTTCVSVWIRKVQGNSNGVMFDCADDLIYHTPDIPGKGNLYLQEAIIFKDDAVYQNVREGFNITYQFSTKTIPVDQKLMAIYFPVENFHHVSEKYMTYPFADQNMSTATVVFYWILIGICLMGLLVLVVVCIKCCVKKPRQRPQSKPILIMSSLAANIDQHRSENQINRQYTEISV